LLEIIVHEARNLSQGVSFLERQVFSFIFAVNCQQNNRPNISENSVDHPQSASFSKVADGINPSHLPEAAGPWNHGPDTLRILGDPFSQFSQVLAAQANRLGGLGEWGRIHEMPMRQAGNG